jgi:hypothetical protein
MLAAPARLPGRTDAVERSRALQTGGALCARVGSALVDVDPAVWPLESLGALAVEPVVAVYTSPSVVARVRVAVVDI